MRELQYEYKYNLGSECLAEYEYKKSSISSGVEVKLKADDALVWGLNWPLHPQIGIFLYKDIYFYQLFIKYKYKQKFRSRCLRLEYSYIKLKRKRKKEKKKMFSSGCQSDFWTNFYQIDISKWKRKKKRKERKRCSRLEAKVTTAPSDWVRPPPPLIPLWRFHSIDDEM